MSSTVKNGATNARLVHHERHWHYVHRRRTLRKNHTTRELLYGQTISVVGSLFAGFVLELSKNELLTLTGVLLILPGIFELGGSVAGAMAARIAHRLSTGVSPKLIIRSSLLHALFLATTAGCMLGVIAALLAGQFAGSNELSIFLTVSLTCISAGLVGFPLVAFITWRAWRMGVDPDNVIGPIETTIFDILSLLIVAQIIGVVL